MGSNFGTGVSRVLSPDQANLVQVIWQQGKPPLDSELNLLQQIDDDWRRILALRGMPSGFMLNPTNAQSSYITNVTWSNWFRFGQQRTGEKRSIEWAVVNGWLVPVTGTLTGSPPGSPNDTDTWSRVTLDPPPANSGDTRIDFVFLEVWLARTPPNPSASNKPSASGLYRYGNVEGGYSFLADDLQDPAIGFETTQRVQLQYRIRVVTGLVGLASYPDGFDPTIVKARGAAAANTAFVFTNMRNELGDPGLWRAGDGTQNALGTVDGYVYAVPMCAVFRRNTVAWDGDPSQNLNGGFNRNPTAIDRTGWKTFSTVATLAADMSASAGTASLVSVSNVPTPLTPATPVFIMIGDEIMTYSVITGTTMTIASRGVLGSKAEIHKAGTPIVVISGRPDQLYSDQVVKSDILDLRHAVNPNGFDADTLLQANIDKLLRGELRANWKRSGGGPQGSFIPYQDKISVSPAPIGVTKLDGPDNIREVFSDAAMLQKINVILSPPVGVGPTQPVTTTWGLSLTATDNNNAGLAGNFQAADIITIPIGQFKNGIPGSDGDQIRFVGSAETDPNLVVRLRIDGDADFLTEGTHFSIGPNPMTPTSDLQITLIASSVWPTTRRLYVQLHVLYGPGRGLSRRPDAIHSVAYLSSGADIMTQLAGIPANNVPTRVAWAVLWGKYRKVPFGGLLPVTAESYIDPGSKTVILTPFRRIDMPDITRTLDGTAVNLDQSSYLGSSTGSSTGTSTLTDTFQNFITSGVSGNDAVIITSATNPAAVGSYYIPIAAPIGATTITLNRAIPTSASITYQIYRAQGLMPLNDRNQGPKWATTDPLGLFRGVTYGDNNRNNIFIPLPRTLAPGWGEVRVPILHSDTATFDEGINFMVLSKKGGLPRSNAERNYVPYSNGSLTYAPFSTLNLNTVSTPASYNAAFTYGGNSFAGVRFFTDSRGLGRQGLEMPPFYGIARLFAVYEANDYKTNGSAYNPTTRVFQAGGATNLLRQNFSGPTFWIEKDNDGDSTFILNADVIDTTKSPNPISSFAAAHYVIESSIFGFDRGSFDLDQGFRLVMTREVVALDPSQAGNATRTNNIGGGADADVTSPTLVVPGPSLGSDEVAINYSRTVYQGDAWGSQTSYQDIGYTPGPLTSGTAAQIAHTPLDVLNLTRPNQKVLEVLSSTGFVTTLGTGRLAGDLDAEAKLDFRSIGWEDPFQSGSLYPPETGLDPRPSIKLEGLIEGEGFALPLGTEYHGCTERLPMGALYRDKDFRGGFVGGFGDPNFSVNDLGPFLYMKTRSPGILASGVLPAQTLEQFQVPVNTVTVVSGQPGELTVHVDGEQGNYSLLTNYRTHRGGSVFSASAPRPGGEINSLLMIAGPHAAAGRALGGIAMLVRNTVTSVGSNEVSAGSELMLLVVTTVTQFNIDGAFVAVLMGTNGTAEGLAAADLYHLEGRPLMRDNVRVDIDPSTIVLASKVHYPFLP